MGSLIRPQPVFQPAPPCTDAARESKTKGTVVIALVLDAEGCPQSEDLLKPLSKGLAEQALATVRWWAYEPARYEEIAVAMKLNVTFNFVIF